MSGTRVISTTSRRELSSSFYFLPGKAPEEIHSILTEILACFHPGRAKDLSAPLYLSLADDKEPFNNATNYGFVLLPGHVCVYEELEVLLEVTTKAAF